MYLVKLHEPLSESVHLLSVDYKKESAIRNLLRRNRNRGVKHTVGPLHDVVEHGARCIAHLAGSS